MSMTAPRKAAEAAILGLALWLAMGGAVAADRAKVLNVYAWPEYFPPALISKFQAETGIHVNYAVLDSPATAETILSVGHSDYDIVTMNAAPELARLENQRSTHARQEDDASRPSGVELADSEHGGGSHGASARAHAFLLSRAEAGS